MEMSSDRDEPEEVNLDAIHDSALRRLTRTYWHVFSPFVVASSALSVLEAVLIAWPPVGVVLTIQKIILALSTVIVIIINAMVYKYLRKNENLTMWQKLHCLVAPGESKLEVMAIIYGWIFLFFRPAVANLRVFRVVRTLWYLEIKEPEEGDRGFVIRKAGLLVIKYMEAIGNELFSASTKGATVVLAFYFFTTYVFGTLFLHETGEWQPNNPDWWVPGSNAIPCDTLTHCFITMMRLSLYDGNGFDFLTNASNSPHKWLAFLAIVYMLLTAVVLLNGLIGIFGDAFSNPEEGEDDEEDEYELGPREKAAFKKKSKEMSKDFMDFYTTSEKRRKVVLEVAKAIDTDPPENVSATVFNALNDAHGDRENLLAALKASVQETDQQKALLAAMDQRFKEMQERLEKTLVALVQKEPKSGGDGDE